MLHFAGNLCFHTIKLKMKFVLQMATLITLVIIIVINLGVGILPHMDNFAHIGGFITGFLLGFVFLIRPHFGWVNRRYEPVSSRSSSPKFKAYQRVLWVLSLILLIIGYGNPHVLKLHALAKQIVIILNKNMSS